MYSVTLNQNDPIDNLTDQDVLDQFGIVAAARISLEKLLTKNTTFSVTLSYADGNELLIEYKEK